jgi:hypothetical protein
MDERDDCEGNARRSKELVVAVDPADGRTASQQRLFGLAGQYKALLRAGATAGSI